MNDNVLIGVHRAVIMDRNSQILIVRNAGNKFWHYPGGKWNPRSETILEGLAREIDEELGLNELNFSFLAIQELHRGTKTYVETYWAATIDNSSNSINMKVQAEEIEDTKWISINDLSLYGVLPSGLIPLLQDSASANRYLGNI